MPRKDKPKLSLPEFVVMRLRQEAASQKGTPTSRREALDRLMTIAARIEAKKHWAPDFLSEPERPRPLESPAAPTAPAQIPPAETLKSRLAEAAKIRQGGTDELPEG